MEGNMAKQTIRDQLIQALERRGETIVQTAKSTKFIVMTRQAGGFYYLGKAGALRVGRTVAESRAAEYLRDTLLSGDNARIERQMSLPPY